MSKSLNNFQDQHKDRKSSWFPKFTRSALNCFSKCKPSKSDQNRMAETYYKALENCELRISNPYLYDGTDCANAEIYRRSWKLEPFPALPVKKRRCKSESNVARNSLLIGGHVQWCPVIGDDPREKKNWIKESKMKLEQLFRRKCKMIGKKRTNSLGNMKFDASKHYTDAKYASTFHDFASANDAYFCPVDFNDDLITHDGHRPLGCDPNVWRQKLERWAASLQCAIQVIKREENLRLEITQLRMHRELLERQLEGVSSEKERWKRKCMEMHKCTISCQNCGALVFPFNCEKQDANNLTSKSLPIQNMPEIGAQSSMITEDEFRLTNQNRHLDDDIFNALHDLILYYT